MRRIIYSLAAMAVALAIFSACSGEWYVNDDYGYNDYGYYDSSCPRHRTYGPLNCNYCHW